MSVGIIGKKCGMTRIFSEDGQSIPVTVIQALPNRVTQIKTVELDGYRAVQVTSGTKRANKVNKPLAGHLKKAGVQAGLQLKEISLQPEELPEIKVGDELTVSVFTPGQKVDVRGITKGKGFAGAIKRHHFSRQDETHGNSLSHRAPGSIGQRQTPGRVFKGKRMAGHLGNVQRCIQNQEVVQIDVARNLVLIKGAIPGAPGGNVVITPSTKNKGEN